MSAAKERERLHLISLSSSPHLLFGITARAILLANVASFIGAIWLVRAIFGWLRPDSVFVMLAKKACRCSKMEEILDLFLAFEDGIRQAIREHQGNNVRTALISFRNACTNSKYPSLAYPFGMMIAKTLFDEILSVGLNDEVHSLGSTYGTLYVISLKDAGFEVITRDHFADALQEVCKSLADHGMGLLESGFINAFLVELKFTPPCEKVALVLLDTLSNQHGGKKEAISAVVNFVSPLLWYFSLRDRGQEKRAWEYFLNFLLEQAKSLGDEPLSERIHFILLDIRQTREIAV